MFTSNRLCQGEETQVGVAIASALYASLLLSSGANLRVSKQLMRHSTAEMTLSAYTQTIGNEKRDAGERVPLLVFEGGKAASLTPTRLDRLSRDPDF